MSDQAGKYSHNPDLEHRHGDHYSGKRKIPTVQKFNEDERRKREEAKRQEAYSIKKGLSRVVRDPITGGSVQIQDSNGDYQKAASDMSITVPRKNLVSASGGKYETTEFNCEGLYLSEIQNDPSSDQHEHHLGKFLKHGVTDDKGQPKSTSSSSGAMENDSVESRRKDDKHRQRQDKEQTAANDEDGWVDIPMRGQRSNILFYTMPDPDFDRHHENVVGWFMHLPYCISICECFRYFIFDFGRLTSIMICLAIGYWIKEQMDISWRSVKLDTVKRRADQALAKRVPESVEWLNSVVQAVWKQINPDIFIPAIDKLEDIMQASAPSIVHAVKVDDLGHGDHAVRLLSMRYLEDKEIEDAEDSNSNDEQAGDFVNIEVTVAYSARASVSDTASKVKNMHILIIFYGGLSNVLGVPIPIFTEILGFIATLRLRLQFTPEFPYIKNTTFSLMGLPKFDISVVPISRKLLNISNLPIISTFIKKSMKAALAEYNAPKSYTIDLGSLIVSDGIPYETVAIGVIIVHIHRAQDLEAQDKTGLSDPYIVVALSNYGKPIFSSRIIEKTLNPVFEETCFVLVTPEALRSKERLSLQLWDSDRVSADDENGRVEFDVQDLVANAGAMEDRKDGLISSVEGKSMSGELSWSVGYFSKRRCNPNLATDGSDPNLSDDVKEIQDVAGRCALPDTESCKAIRFCSPDPDWPSGILRIQIHLATDLYANSLRGSWQHDMRYKQGQDTSAPEVEADEAQSPNAYCNIMLNDQVIYRTRTKPFSNKPYFNAGTERFVRDWRTAVCLVAVYDKRTRERDALLGVIPLRLSEAFQNASQVSKMYPLIGGTGQGKLKITLLWESIEHKVPKHLLGWDIGKLRIMSTQLRYTYLSPRDSSLKHMKIKIYTSAALTTISGRHCHKEDGGLIWELHNTKGNPFELPCVRRHASALCFEFQSATRMNTYAIATFWLTDLLDDDPRPVKIDVWRTENDEDRSLVRQNRLDREKHRDMQRIGTLEFDAVFLRGLGDCYDSQVRSDGSLRQAHEAWKAAMSYARRNAGDSYLVGQKHTQNGGLVPSDPYADLNENVLSGHSKDNSYDVNEGFRNATTTSPSSLSERSEINSAEPPEPYSQVHDLHSPSGQKGEETYRSMSTSESKSSISITQWNRAWAQHHNLGKPLDVDDKELKRRGSIALPRSKRYSTLISEITRFSSDSRLLETSRGSDTEVDKDSARYKKLEKQKMHREQRGSQQFKPFRTLKWAKDGLVLGKEKLMLKAGSKQRMRQPDIESEI